MISDRLVDTICKLGNYLLFYSINSPCWDDEIWRGYESIHQIFLPFGALFKYLWSTKNLRISANSVRIMADKIPPNDTSATTAKSGKTASTPGHRPHLCSDGSPPPLTTPAAPPTAWPPSAPDKYSGQLSDPSNDEGSPSLLVVPISTGFQRVPTPLGRSPTLPVAAISPPRLRNSFSALDDGNNPPLLVERVPPSAPSPIPAGWDAFAATRADNPSLATVDVMFKDFADFTGRLLQD